MLYQGNPFSTRYVRPGALPYQFSPRDSAALLLQRLRDHDGWGQIVGPHGSGKTTLLHALVDHLAGSGYHPLWYTVEGGQRRLPRSLFDKLRAAAGPSRTAPDRFAPQVGGHTEQDASPTGETAQCLVIVDGYEQLGWLARTRLKHACRQASSGLLITTHRDAGLPPLYTAHCSLSMAENLVRQLLRRCAEDSNPVDGRSADDANQCGSVVKSQDIAHAYHRWKGNVREMLFSLYDLYESRRVR